MNIKIAIAIKHNNRSEPCKPSLYITRINELYTSAEPVSFCKTIKPAGIANNKPINARLEKRMILKPCLLITFAIARQVANFPNSAGCIRIPPISNHERAPWDSTPKTSTAAKSPTVSPKITKEKAVKTILSVSKIKKPNTKAAPIHNNCFPYFRSISKILLWLSSYTAA